MNPLKILTKIFQFFSVYVDPFEKKVDRFLKHVRRRSKRDLQALIQEDLVKLAIFLEYKFKGYKSLKKSYRRKLYRNAEIIKRDFAAFYETKKDEIEAQQNAENIPKNLRQDEHFHYLLAVMNFLKPGQVLKYQEASNFEKLLRDPNSETLIGDCNQIVTLYIYLFSLRYPVTELQVKILPDHICLHYKGIDIETTSGHLTKYDDYTFISSVEEIVPTNLLDISDPTEKQFKVSAKSMLKSAELAYQFSGHRQTVEKNLFVAYHNVAVYYAHQKNFSKAKLFANKSGKTKLQYSISNMEAIDHLKNKRYQKAAEIFRRLGDRKGEKACYQNEMVDLFAKIKNFKTIPEFKPHKATLKKIKELASKAENQQMIDFANDVLKKLS